VSRKSLHSQEFRGPCLLETSHPPKVGSLPSRSKEFMIRICISCSFKLNRHVSKHHNTGRQSYRLPAKVAVIVNVAESEEFGFSTEVEVIVIEFGFGGVLGAV
jgi:hypothetical protein